MKFQDSSFNGLKVTVGTKSVTHAPTHARSKSNMPHQIFQSWGHNKVNTFNMFCIYSRGGKEVDVRRKGNDKTAGVPCCKNGEAAY